LKDSGGYKFIFVYDERGTAHEGLEKVGTDE
jgi:hypothetical protein